MTERIDATAITRDYRPGDESALVRLFERCFDVPLTLAFWRWRFLECPEPTDFLIIEVDGEIVGHHATQYFDTWVGGERMVVSKGGDFMIAPEHRGRRLHRGMRDLWKEREGKVQLGMGFPLDVTVALLRKAGSDSVGRVPQWVAWTSPAGVRTSNEKVPSPAAALVAAAGNLLRRLPGRTTLDEITSFDSVEGELDALADRSRDIAHCIRIRDAAYLRWRWLENPERAWRVLVARDRTATLRGFVVFGGSKHPRIVDVLAEDRATLRALVAGAVDRLARDGAPLVTMELNDPRPWVRGTLMRLGMLPRGIGPQVTVVPHAPRLGPKPGRLDGWFITAGDTDMV
jgi:hypothetical protein